MDILRDICFSQLEERNIYEYSYVNNQFEFVYILETPFIRITTESYDLESARHLAFIKLARYFKVDTSYFNFSELHNFLREFIRKMPITKNKYYPIVETINIPVSKEKRTFLTVIKMVDGLKFQGEICDTSEQAKFSALNKALNHYKGLAIF